MTRSATDNSSHLENAAANTKRGSQVQSHVAPEPDAYLRLDTGEVIGVPASDATMLNNEFDKWNRLMHEQLLANKVLAVCDERMEQISRILAETPRKATLLRETKEEAERAQDFAIQWRDEATEKLRKELQPLDKLGSAGKKLVELIPVVEKKSGGRAQFELGKDNGEWERDGLSLEKSWSFKSAAGLRKQIMEKDSYKGLGPLRVVSSDKLKETWPKFKDMAATKWSEVYSKSGKDGKRKINPTKIRKYLGEQVTKLKVSSKDFGRLEISNADTFGPEALVKWNENARFSREGKLVCGDAELGDIDLSAEAAAMRYFTGASLLGEIAPLKGNVRIKAEANAEIAFAEGRAAASLYLPSRAGVLLYLLDIEQIQALIQNKKMPREPYDIGAVRLAVDAELKGASGASAVVGLSLDIEMKDVEAVDLDGRKKPATQSRIRGGRKKGSRKARAVEVFGKGSEWKNKAGLTGELTLFAGASAGLELRGSLQWRNPHNKEKIFEVMASIAPQIRGQAGLGGSAKLAVDYVDGIFRITAHAGLCFGLGAEGTVSFAVNAKQLASFICWIYYNLLHVGFMNLAILSKRAFEALVYLTCLLAGEENRKKIEDYFLGNLKDAFKALNNRYQNTKAACELGRRILANPEATRVSPPETKGILIYQLTRHGKESILNEPGLGNGYLYSQKQAILAILRQTQLKSDLENVIQHIHPHGEKVTIDHNLDTLREFFKVEGPGKMDFPGQTRHEKEFEELLRQHGLTGRGGIDAIAMGGDFSGWYDAVHKSLKDEATRGFTALPNDTVAYALQRDGPGGHPLYVSAEAGFYPRTA